MKLCVFPNDPLQAYFDKGELKNRYFNPNNLFDEIHVISPTNQDIEVSKVRQLAGDAKLRVYPVGPLSLLNFKSKLSKIKKIIKHISPDVIRAYNPLIQGWLAAKISRELDIPFIVSIHNNYDKDSREFYKIRKKYLQYLKFWYTGKFIEPYSLRCADEIICAYRFLVPYVRKIRKDNIEVIYNRVNLAKFSPDIKPKFTFKEPTIIYVARLDSEKNQECLIKAIQDLNVKLILVGNGPFYEKLSNLTKFLNCEDKVIFLKSIANEELGECYTSADIFVAALKQGGVSIPMLEAMASGLPLIIPERGNNEKEDIDSAVKFVKNEPSYFKEAIKELLKNEDKRKEMIRKGLEISKNIDGKAMEDKEEKVYRKLIKKS